ncbi:MAG: phosphosulfolactate synthase [Methanophagales archaeon]|nr:phosphosulfolactate synthase [Methanophagales archaeon]MCW3141174.1 phosphosulfolactate synthase [Methanophagales archaeon]
MKSKVLAFETIGIANRTEKPRDVGLTMVLDKGLGYHAAQDLVEYTSEYIDIIKLGWGTHRLCSEEVVKRKIQLYTDNSIMVCNGGTLFEIAYQQRRTDDFFEYAHQIGLRAIEISDGSIRISRAERSEIIRKCKNMGFEVFTEVGKKNPLEDAKLSLDYRIKEAKSDMDAGATKVIIEARESGKGIGVYDKEGKIKEDMVKKLIEGIGLNEIMFEAPKKSQQVYFILNLGPEVNLGNIKPEDVIPLETLRRGLRGDTFGKI